MLGRQYHQAVAIRQVEAMQRMVEALRTMARADGIAAMTSGRIKSFASTVRKMRARRLTYRDVTDAVGVRVIVTSIGDCYCLLQAVEHRFQPIHGRKRDYIASPKDNGYRSLHTTVRDDLQVPIEVQFRTFGMHEQSEHGSAAHRQFKIAQAHHDVA
jgi:GTP pyrophosphokinase